MAEPSRAADVWSLIGLAAFLITWVFGWHGLLIYFAALTLVNALTRVLEK